MLAITRTERANMKADFFDTTNINTAIDNAKTAYIFRKPTLFETQFLSDDYQRSLNAVNDLALRHEITANFLLCIATRAMTHLFDETNETEFSEFFKEAEVCSQTACEDLLLEAERLELSGIHSHLRDSEPSVSSLFDYFETSVDEYLMFITEWRDITEDDDLFINSLFGCTTFFDVINLAIFYSSKAEHSIEQYHEKLGKVGAQ